MNWWKEIRQSLITSVWFMFLTFPIMIIRVNTIENVVEWRWARLIFIGVGVFIFSFIWRWALRKKGQGRKMTLLGRIEQLRRNRAQAKGAASTVTAAESPPMQEPATPEGGPVSTIDGALSGGFPAKSNDDLSGRSLGDLFRQKKFMYPGLAVAAAFFIIFPFFTGMYQTNIMSTALMYVMLGLGLNIVVGLGGLLHLGYIAFYAVGAYTYALLNHHLGFSFWVCLPLGGLFSVILGFILGIPVLRLRGDYLAIVTLAFGEIIRIVLENWNDFSFGPSGIANIPRPGFFGVDMSLEQATVYIYFLMIGLTIFTIFIVARLKNSRLGRAWEAMREDSIASEAMGIDIMKSKLTSFALGALWAGLAGVVFAAKTTFINPASFTVWESVLVLCIVVLGGMGSIAGVVVGAFALILLPEYLRAFSQYRMLIFGAVLVIMMIFRPEGFIRARRHVYTFTKKRENRG